MDDHQLQQEGLFRGLTDEALAAIMRAGHPLAMAEGAFLFHQDEPAERIYLLTQGRIKLAQLSVDGLEVIMNMATPGKALAVIGVVEGAVYPVSAEVMGPSRLIYWSQGEMLDLMARHPPLAFNMMKMLAGQVREFQDRFRELATERVERRLARTLIRLAGQVGRKTEEGVLLDVPLTRQELAEMTGTTLYTVSRILNQWETQGLVQVGREWVMIRFPHGLVRIAEDLSG